MEQTAAAAAAYKRNIARERQHTWPHCVPPTLLTGNLAGHRAPSGHHPPPPASLPTCLRADPPVLPTPQVPLHPPPFHPPLIHSLFIHPSVTRPLRLPTSQFHLHQITYILWAESTDDSDQCPTGMMSSTLLLELKSVHLCQ